MGCVVAVVGATAVSAAWHAEHDADQNCVVCKLRHQPVTDLSGAIHVGPIATPARLIGPSGDQWSPADTDAQVPARAPPLS